jgi:hypothetical protein
LNTCIKIDFTIVISLLHILYIVYFGNKINNCVNLHKIRQKSLFYNLNIILSYELHFCYVSIGNILKAFLP